MLSVAEMSKTVLTTITPTRENTCWNFHFYFPLGLLQKFGFLKGKNVETLQLFTFLSYKIYRESILREFQSITG